MMKALLSMLVFLLLSVTTIQGQTIQEGITHLYAGRLISADKIFKQILATTPTSVEAAYWVGQTAIEIGEVNNQAARKIYESLPATIGNAALILVGKGHVELLDSNVNEARQLFEMALTMTRTKKGDDPVILNAIGRAHVDAKAGNLVYAIEKLELATQRDPKNANIFLNLGNAYRKANPGQGGGMAYTNYRAALALNPLFVFPHIRIAKLFETQRNWSLVLENLYSAIAKDPNFSPAYYELFYFYFSDQKFDSAEYFLNKYVASKKDENDPQNDYLAGQLCWAKKNYPCAIEKGSSVIAKMGEKTNPRVYKLMAYAHVDKGDTMGAKKYIDSYFEKEKTEGIIPNDIILKGKIYSTLTGDDNILFNSYIQAAMLVLIESRTKIFQEGVAYFKRKGDRKKEAQLRELSYDNKKYQSDGELFNIALAYHQAGEYSKAIELFARYATKNPDSIFGHLWSARANYVVDTTMVSVIPHYERTLEISALDKLRYKNYGIESSKFLAGYYNNVLNESGIAIEYLQRALVFDTANNTVKELLEILQRASAPKPPSQTPAKPANKSTSAIDRPTNNDAAVKN